MILFVLCFDLYFVFAQRTDFRMHEYSKQNNIGEELIKSTCQDSTGIYYFAADGGIYSFLNDQFRLFDIPKGKSEYFKKIIELKSGKLLAISDDGIYQISPALKNINCRLIYDFKDQPNTPKYLKNVYEDRKGDIWLSDYMDVYRIQEGRIHKYEMGKNNLTSSYARSFHFLDCDNGNLIVVSQPGNFYKYNTKEDRFIQIKYRDKAKVHSAFKIGANEFLLGTSKGIYKYIFDFKGSIVHRELISRNIIASCFAKLSENRVLAGTWFQGVVEIELNESHSYYHVGGFPYFAVNDIYKDHYGKFWVSTNSGVVVMEKKFFSTQFLSSNSQYVVSMCLDSNQEVQFTSRDHFYNTKDHSEIITDTVKIKGSINVFREKFGIRVIGTEQGSIIIKQEGKESQNIILTQKPVSKIEIVSPKLAWVVANKILFKIDLENVNSRSYEGSFYSHPIVQDICIDQQGKLYVGGEYKDAYLFEYNEEKDQFTNISVNIPFDDMADFWVKDLKYHRDTLFIATSTGLFTYNNNQIKLVDLGKMSRMEINSVTHDKYHSIWVNNSHGIIRKNRGGVNLFGLHQGLPSKTFTSHNLLIDKYNYLWVGTSNGIAYAKIDREIPETPMPIVFLASDEETILDHTDEIQLMAKSLLVLNVTASIYPQKQNIFQYCIYKDGQKITRWKLLSAKNQILISNLDQGNYVLHVKCKHEGNYIWSKARMIPLKVSLAWYYKWYTVFAGISLIVLIVFFRDYYHKKKTIENLQELERQVSDRTLQYQKANRQLEEANTAKDRLMSIIAHDLRNPFNAIRSFSKMLLDADDVFTKEDRNDMLESIYKSSDDTFKLLESLLQWANVQKGNFKMNREVFDIAEIVKTNLDLHRGLALVKEIRLDGSYAKYKVNADRAMIDTVVRNLLSNAIKYSYEKQNIHLEVVKKKAFLEISICDEGVGMNQEQIENLFKVDTVSSRMGTANETGTGFGLMLCKEFVELNGGKIWVESTEGEGTCFYFTVMLA